MSVEHLYGSVSGCLTARPLTCLIHPEQSGRLGTFTEGWRPSSRAVVAIKRLKKFWLDTADNTAPCYLSSAAAKICILQSGMNVPSVLWRKRSSRMRQTAASPFIGIVACSLSGCTLISPLNSREQALCIQWMKKWTQLTLTLQSSQDAFRRRKQVRLLPENRLLRRGSAVRGEELAQVLLSVQ